MRRKDRGGVWEWAVRWMIALVLCWGVAAGIAVAQTPASSETDRIAALEKTAGENAASIAKAQSAGDNAWMLTSAALVLMMSGPGLALFYGGLVRKKNILGTMMQTFAMMAVITVLWGVRDVFAGVRKRERVHRWAA